MCNYGRSKKAPTSIQFQEFAILLVPPLSQDSTTYNTKFQEFQQVVYNATATSIFLTFLGALTRNSHCMFCLVLYCVLVKKLDSNIIVFTITWC